MGISILCIEDDIPLARLVQKRLNRAGYEVDLAYESADGLARLARNPYDVLILDERLPEASGLSIIARLATRGKLLPIILMTAFGDETLAENALRMGAMEYMVKDGDYLDQLPLLVRQAIEKHRVLASKQRTIEEQKAIIAELEAFAHTVAHDLKNPLNVVIGTAEMLVQLDDLHPEIQHAHHNMRNIAYKMYSIIEELLLLATLRKDEQEVMAHLLDMPYIIDEVLSRLSFMIERKNALILRPESWEGACGYSPWVEEVWMNYISNAIKYGGNPPVIHLGSDPASNDMVRFWVRDNGKGLPDEVREKLFTAFTPRLQRAEGHGLGLSIVRRIVERLGGEVGVDSTTDSGSTFWFTLPAAPDEAG